MILSKRNLRNFVVVSAVILIIYFLWFIRSGLYPFIIAFFLAYLLNPVVCYIESKGLSRRWAIVLIYILLFSILTIGGSKLLPVLVRELDKFGKELPAMIKKSEDFLQFIQWQYQNSILPYSLRLAIDDALLSFEGNIQGFITDVVSGIMGMVGHFIGLVISPVLAFYLLHDWFEIKDELLMIFPSGWRREIVMICKDIDRIVSGIIRGQLAVAVIVGILVTTGLYFLNVKFALLIGILAGLFDVIPYFGALIGAAPAVTLALLDSPWLALKVVVLFLMVHQLEGNIIQPQIIGENVGLHPLSVIFFVFVGGEIGGLTGMLIGVPIAAIIKVFIRHLLKILV